MSEQQIEVLEKELAQLVEAEIPAHPAQDIHDALQVADTLESKGFSFALKDMCPKSLSDTMWRATFSKDGAEFAAEHTHSAVAVCTAAVGALKN